MRIHQSSPALTTAPVATGTTPTDGHAPRKCIVLVRHGQTTFNVEKRLPGQLPGIPLTEEGRRQAVRAAVALSGLPLTTIISSPLERARDTALLIARGWGLSVLTDDRLMDTDVGHWSGRQLDEIAKSDPAWKAFVEHGSQPPVGVESLAHVMERAVAVVEQLRHDERAGEYIVVVAHADVVKLIVAHYLGIAVDCARFMSIDNASISALGFEGEGTPAVLTLNWTPIPGWLFPRATSPEAVAAVPVPPESVQPTANGLDHQR
ncbi:MAG TPA: histidine phosphatase family protein [Ktedonobacterales bacterium]